jgi:hypothetical protein
MRDFLKGRRRKAARKRKRPAAGTQLRLFDLNGGAR